MIFLIVSLLRSRDYISCELCKRQIMRNNAKVHSFSSEKNYRSECKKMGFEGSLECEKNVKGFGNAIIDGLRDPELVCQATGKCPMKPVAFGKSDAKPMSFANDCDYCVKIFTFMTGDGLKSTGAPMGLRILHSVCHKVPPAVPLCSMLTEHHIEKMVTLIKSKVEILELCQKNGLCN